MQSFISTLLIPGRKVAVDASMCIYQFLIAVRQDGSMLTNEDGETTRSLHKVFLIRCGKTHKLITHTCMHHVVLGQTSR